MQPLDLFCNFDWATSQYLFLPHGLIKRRTCSSQCTFIPRHLPSRNDDEEEEEDNSYCCRCGTQCAEKPIYDIVVDLALLLLHLHECRVHDTSWLTVTSRH